MNLGSHMLLWGEEINEKYLSEPHGHLFHIHFLHYLHQSKEGAGLIHWYNRFNLLHQSSTGKLYLDYNFYASH